MATTRKSSASSPAEESAAGTMSAPAAQATPITHDEKVERVNARIGELRVTRYDPLGGARDVDPMSAEDKAERVNARIRGMAARG